MDLVNGIPRSPYESMHGIVFLPRAIDKARAEIAGTLDARLSAGPVRATVQTDEVCVTAFRPVDPIP